ncbi:hypothetical protein ACFV1N_11555 [Streptosporangium canum]
MAALSAQDAGGQAVGESQKCGDLGARIAIGGEVAGLLRGGEPGYAAE